MDSAVHAKILALRESPLMAAALRWASSHSFVFESNYKSVVAWIVDPSSVPWHFHTALCKCYHVFGVGISWSLFHIDRSGNETADILARLGSSSSNFIMFA